MVKDENNQMLSLAWVEVENENKNSSAWFISPLQEDIGLGDGTGFTIMSYMQKVNSNRKAYFLDYYILLVYSLF